MGESDEESSHALEQQQQQQQLHLPMLLQLEGQVKQRHGHHRSRGSSNSSISSHSSRSSRGPRMPVIEEHPAGQEDHEEQWLSTGGQEHCQSATTAGVVAGFSPSMKAARPMVIMQL